eukprot:sb/3479329/
MEIDLARYLLFADKKNIPVKRADVAKNVLKDHHRLFPTVLEGARKHLKETFDFSVCEIDDKRGKMYILKNDSKAEGLQQLTRPSHSLPQLGLLTVVLSLIHMADNSLDEADLWDTLDILGISRNEGHVDFGDVEKIFTEFCKQQYIERKKVTSTKGDGYQYSAGWQGYIEVKIEDILSFVANVTNINVNAWKAQHSTHTGALNFNA